MEPKQIKIGVIHSSFSLADLVERLRGTTDCYFEVSTKGLDAALPVGRRMQAQGVEVILSRKGTAHLLRENLQIPVVSIPLSTLGILNSLKEAMLVGRKILLPCFRNIVNGLDEVQELLKIDLVLGVYNDSASLKALVLQAKKQGCHAVVGGGIAVGFAQKYGLAGLEIKTSEDTFLTSLESAMSVVWNNRREKEKTERYRCALGLVEEGVVAFDAMGAITVVNRQAMAYLGLKEEELEGQPIQRFLPKVPVAELIKMQKPVYEDLQQIKGKMYVFNHVPVIMDNEMVGGVTTIVSTKTLVSTEQRIRKRVTQGLKAKYFLSDLKFCSRNMRQTVDKAIRFSQTDGTILITGETGTGKEILAQGVHNESNRSRHPFVSINCAALPEQLLESELFGYEEGAFTGSKKGGKPGLFEMAHQGTILLDEVSATSGTVQSHLLRVIGEREVMRIGGCRLIPIDVRIIANSNLDLVEEAIRGDFREDLFFRLHVLPIRIPPLRERRGDIELLTNEFIGQTSRSHSLPPIPLPAEVTQMLGNYSWPGNVRQLLHFVEQLVLMSGGAYSNEVFYDLYEELIRFDMKCAGPASQLPGETISSMHSPIFREEEIPQSEAGDRTLLKRYSKSEEKVLIQRALEENRYNRTKTAKQLGISRATLWKRMKSWGL